MGDLNRVVDEGREGRQLRPRDRQRASGDLNPGSPAPPLEWTPDLGPAGVMRLQRTVGNAAVSELVKDGAGIPGHLSDSIRSIADLDLGTNHTGQDEQSSPVHAYSGARSAGLRFSPESQISASEMKEKIDRSALLQPYMKRMFAVRENSLVLDPKYDRPSNYVVPRDVDVPQWFVNALDAVGAGEWYFTTVVSFVADAEMAYKSDAGPDSSHGFEGRRRPENMNVMGYTYKSEERLGKPFEDLRAEPKKASSRRSDEGLIIVANRVRHSRDKGLDVPLSDEQILRTLIHELAAHAAPTSKGIQDTSHPLHDQGLMPQSGSSESERMAYAVDEYFRGVGPGQEINRAEALKIFLPVDQ